MAERRHLGAAADALRHEDLEGVARGDVLLRLGHRFHVVLAAGLLHPVGGVAWLVRPGRDRRRQRRQHALRLVGGSDHRHRPPDVVEGDDARGEHELHLGDAGVVLVRGRQRDRLEPRHPVVAQVADGAASERRLTGPRAGLRPRELDRLLEAGRDRSSGAEERVAADLFAALDGLQQERRRSQRLAQLQVGADRRDHVGGKRCECSLGAHQGNKKAPRLVRRKAWARGGMPRSS